MTSPGYELTERSGFLPRSGIATTQQTIDGLGKAYSMSPELSLALAVIAIAISGDPVTGTSSNISFGGGLGTDV